jgi:hypothetical protein
MKSSLPWPRPKNWNTLWPALKGSLAKVYKPCIRPGCPQCLDGTKHPAHILSFSQKGKRRCMYVPESLVPFLQHALANGRRLETLLYEQGPQILKQFRRQRQKDEKQTNHAQSKNSKMAKNKPGTTEKP